VGGYVSLSNIRLHIIYKDLVFTLRFSGNLIIELLFPHYYKVGTGRGEE
jgi:hypothetical protein